jgi:hypothetical protein
MDIRFAYIETEKSFLAWLKNKNKYMLRFIAGFIISTLGLVSAVIAVYEYVLKELNLLNQDATAGVIFLGALSFLLYSQLVYVRLKSDRQIRYGQTLSMINDGFSLIHELEGVDGELGADKFMPAFTSLCEKLAHVFSMITATACRVTIKTVVFDEPSGRPEVKTFCRSNKSNFTSDKSRHWIDKNTDFSDIFEKIGDIRGGFFMSNRLPFLFDYQNTSFEICGKPSSNPLLRLWKWPLPYKSTIVVPICPETNPTTENLVGFLCVDSKAIGAFKKEYDVDLLMGVASGLYNLMSRLR